MDRHIARHLVAANCARWATDHADRVDTVHASTGKHVPAEHGALADETRIVVVRVGASANAIVAPCAAIKVDHHRLRPVGESVLDDELEHAGLEVCMGKSLPVFVVLVCVQPR